MANVAFFYVLIEDLTSYISDKYYLFVNLFVHSSAVVNCGTSLFAVYSNLLVQWLSENGSGSV